MDNLPHVVRYAQCGVKTAQEDYHIEMQRFFAFTDEARLTKINNTTLQVDYQGLNNDAIVQQIQFESIEFRLFGGMIQSYNGTPQANLKTQKTFVKQGQALLHLPAQWTIDYQGFHKREAGVFTLGDSVKHFEARQIKSINATVIIPRFTNETEGKPVSATLHFEDN